VWGISPLAKELEGSQKGRRSMEFYLIRFQHMQVLHIPTSQYLLHWNDSAYWEGSNPGNREWRQAQCWCNQQQCISCDPKLFHLANKWLKRWSQATIQCCNYIQFMSQKRSGKSFNLDWHICVPLKTPKYKSQELNIKGSTSKKFHFHYSAWKAGEEVMSIRRLLVITVNAEVK